jgi:hypothetical protein
MKNASRYLPESPAIVTTISTELDNSDIKFVEEESFAIIPESKEKL